MKKIAFITDTHFDEAFTEDSGVDARKNWKIIIADLESKGINEIIMGGDIGAQSAHPYFFESLQPFSFHLLLGNHDELGEVSKFYDPPDQRQELYYSLEDENNRYLFLDSSSYKISKQQRSWLKSKLETEKSSVVFIHHPILEVKTPVDRQHSLKNRNKIKALLGSTSKPITVFCGHYHMNDERTDKNIRQIITQSASYQFEKKASQINPINSEFGYRIIEIEENTIETEVVTFKRNP